MTYYIRNPGPVLKVRMRGISLLAKSATFSRPRSASVQLGYQEGLCYPFTVTRPVTIQEVSIAVEFRDANRVFEKALSKRRLHLSIYVP